MRKVVKLCAAFAAINLVAVAIASEAAARHRHRHSYAAWRYWHERHHRASPVRQERQGSQTAARQENAPAFGPELPKLYVVKTIVNGSFGTWTGPPPAWAGELFIAPKLLAQGRSAFVREHGVGEAGLFPAWHGIALPGTARQGRRESVLLSPSEGRSSVGSRSTELTRPRPSPAALGISWRGPSKRETILPSLLDIGPPR
jgi:hypothetical protein